MPVEELTMKNSSESRQFFSCSLLWCVCVWCGCFPICPDWRFVATFVHAIVICSIMINAVCRFFLHSPPPLPLCLFVFPISIHFGLTLLPSRALTISPTHFLSFSSPSKSSSQLWLLCPTLKQNTYPKKQNRTKNYYCKFGVNCVFVRRFDSRLRKGYPT